jgi:hypothetical protein
MQLLVVTDIFGKTDCLEAIVDLISAPFIFVDVFGPCCEKRVTESERDDCCIKL